MLHSAGGIRGLKGGPGGSFLDMQASIPELRPSTKVRKSEKKKSGGISLLDPTMQDVPQGYACLHREGKVAIVSAGGKRHNCVC